MSKTPWNLFRTKLTEDRAAHRTDYSPIQRNDQFRTHHQRPVRATPQAPGDLLITGYVLDDDNGQWTETQDLFNSGTDPVISLALSPGDDGPNRGFLTGGLNNRINISSNISTAFSDIGPHLDGVLVNGSEDIYNGDTSLFGQLPADHPETTRYGISKSGITFQQRLRILPRHDFPAYAYAARRVRTFENIGSDPQFLAANSAIKQGLSYEYHNFDNASPWVTEDYSYYSLLPVVDTISQGNKTILNPEFNYYSREYDISTTNYRSANLIDGILPSIFYTPSEAAKNKSIFQMSTREFADEIPHLLRYWDRLSHTGDGISTRYKYLTSPEDISFLHSDAQSKKLQYPWYISIDMPSPPAGDFLQALNHTGLSDLVIRKIIEKFESDEPGDRSSDLDSDTSRGGYTEDGMIHSVRESNRNLRSIDFYGNSKSVFERIYNEILEDGVDEACNTYLERLMLLSLRAQINNIVSKRKNRISFAESVALIPCPTETLFYRVTKIAIADADNGVAGVRQITYIGNSKHDAMKFVDTQIRRDINYYYTIDSYILVYGLAYRYRHHSSETQQFTPGGDSAPSTPVFEATGINSGVLPRVDALVHYTPSLKIYEVEVYNTRLSQVFNIDRDDDDRIFGVLIPPLRIIDRPPTPPNVSIVPYRGRNDEVLINLEPSVESLGVGTTGYNFLPLSGADTTVFNRIYRHQKSFENPGLEPGKLEFRGEGDIVKIEVYRTTQTPIITGGGETPRERWLSENASPYSVFKEGENAGEPHKIINLEVQTSFRDNIKPNTPYYYTFRSFDRGSPDFPAGYFSNPSPIYRVETVDNNGMMYVLIDVYEPKRATTEDIKNGSLVRYLEIKPSLLSSEVSHEAPFDGTNIGLTTDGESAFGKTFKIRIKSSDTGRLVDINMSFKNKITGVHREPVADLTPPPPCPVPEEEEGE
jgi:hypothetical protein